MLKLMYAKERYGFNSYSLGNIPEVISEDEIGKIIKEIKRRYSSDKRAENLKVTCHPGVRGFMEPTTSVHFPDWSVEVRYIKS